MNNFKRDVEIAIGAFKYEDDTWADVLERANKEGGIDIKLVYKVLGCILEELDDRKETKEKSPKEDIGVEPEPSIEDGLPEEEDIISGGVSGTEETAEGGTDDTTSTKA